MFRSVILVASVRNQQRSCLPPSPLHPPGTRTIAVRQAGLLGRNTRRQERSGAVLDADYQSVSVSERVCVAHLVPELSLKSLGKRRSFR